MPHRSSSTTVDRGRPGTVRTPTEFSVQARRLDVVNAYQKAWLACPDEPVVRYWLARCWRSDSWYFNPFSDAVQGLDAMVQLILDYPCLFPRVHIRATRPACVHRRHGHVGWVMSSSIPIRILGVNFGRELTGHDVISFHDDDRIELAVGLFDGLR